MPPHTLLLALALSILVTAGATVLQQVATARTSMAQDMAFNVREIQESLSDLHRDLEMVNMLLASSGGETETEAIGSYLAARRNEMSAIRWLGYVPAGSGKPRVLLGSAGVVGFDPRRDPAIARILPHVAETGLRADVPTTYAEVASLAVVLPVPTESGPDEPAVVALVDLNALLREAVSNVFNPGMLFEFRLRDAVLARLPPFRPPHGPWHTFEVSMGTETFTLAFHEADWWVLVGEELPLPVSLLLAAAGLTALWVFARGRLARGVAPAAAPPPPPAEAQPAQPAAANPDVTALRVGRLWQLGELTATLSHDLGQPLNIIRLTAENALDALSNGRGDPERLRRALGAAVDQSRRAQTMMDTLTTVSRRPCSPPVAMSPVEVMRAALSDIQARVRDQRLVLRWHAPPHCPALTGHPARLRAALTHLLANACEALALVSLRGEMGAPGVLAVTCHNDDTHVTYVIADNGPGFPSELRAALKAPLSALPSRDKGCGLGLTIALGVIAELNGTLTIEDADPGTRLEIRLPLPAAAGSRSLLLVDDEPEAVAAMAEYLRGHGWKVRVAGGGNQALALFRQEPADAVVTDLHMVDGDGWTLIGHLHALAPDLPIIAVSTAHADDARRAVAAGAMVVLNKPAGLEEVEEELEGAMAGASDLYA